MLAASFVQREVQLVSQLGAARQRETELLASSRPLPVLRAARDASAAVGGGAAGETHHETHPRRVSAVGRAEAESQAMAASASAAALGEARDECESLRRQQGLMQGRLKEAVAKYQQVLDELSDDRRDLSEKTQEARARFGRSTSPCTPRGAPHSAAPLARPTSVHPLRARP